MILPAVLSALAALFLVAWWAMRPTHQEELDRLLGVRQGPDVAGTGYLVRRPGRLVQPFLAAGLDLTTLQAVAIYAGAMGLAFGAGMAVWGYWPWAVLTAPVGLVLPRVVLARIIAKRLAAIRNQLPGAANTVSSALSTDIPLEDAFAEAAAQTPAPLGPELQRVVQAARHEPIAQALADLALRVPLPETRWMAVTVAVLKDAGGNLPAAFNTLAQLTREKAATAAKQSAILAKPVAEASFLRVYPFLLFGALRWWQPDFVRPFFYLPDGSPNLEGQLVLGGLFGMVLVGGIILQRMAQIRWG